jgi:hypothetical protein
LSVVNDEPRRKVPSETKRRIVVFMVMSVFALCYAL